MKIVTVFMLGILGLVIFSGCDIYVFEDNWNETNNTIDTNKSLVISNYTGTYSGGTAYLCVTDSGNVTVSDVGC